jgi:predicted ABC-type sugar transport system permease subunit
MKICLDAATLDLAPNQMLAISGGVGMTVSCIRGSIWITQNNDRRDVVLAAGETFVVDRDGVALLSAMAPSKVAMQPAVAQRPAWLAKLVSMLGTLSGRMVARLAAPAHHPAVELHCY